MWVADDDGLQAALGVYPEFGFAVEEGQAVPEDVSVARGFDQEGSLAYGELWGGGDGVDVFGLRGEGREDVFVGGEEFGVGCPGLAGGGDVLAGILRFRCWHTV
jgi:hypothetical protein